jgi:hypothetical protein
MQLVLGYALMTDHKNGQFGRKMGAREHWKLQVVVCWPE